MTNKDLETMSEAALDLYRYVSGNKNATYKTVREDFLKNYKITEPMQHSPRNWRYNSGRGHILEGEIKTAPFKLTKWNILILAKLVN